MSKSRVYCFTLNNYTDLEYTAITEMDCRYLVVGKEVGDSGTPHLQGYIYLDNPRSLSSMKKEMPRAHLETAKGTPLQGSQYCKKDGNYYEKGELPFQGKRNDIDNVRDQLNLGKGMREIVETATSYQSMKCAEFMLKYKEKKRNWKTEVIWIHGKSGTGKTRWAYDHYPFDDIHQQSASESKWFESYDAHPVVILDEVDAYVSYTMLKELCDRYPVRVQTKGGSRSFLAKVVVITSLYSPENLFSTYLENGKEMLRRIDKIIELPEL